MEEWSLCFAWNDGVGTPVKMKWIHAHLIRLAVGGLRSPRK
jgi:hypothetical protein